MRNEKTKKIELVAEGLEPYLKLIRDIREDWGFERDDVGGPWYRGQQRKHWVLVPKIVREGHNREIEDEIREEFAVRSPALSRFETLPANDWDLYFLMQHYGAPTRLLDWTESSILALYFAVRDNPGYYDSAVWMLDPYTLNERVAGKDDVISPSAVGTNPKDAKRVSPWLPERWSKKKDLPDHPIAIFPPHIARRISSQKSCFTIHGQQERGFVKFATGANACLLKVVIPAHVVRGMRLDLQNFGIDDTTIFPDLEGLGRALVTAYRDAKEEPPHHRVYVRLAPSKLDKSGVGVFAIKRIPRNTRLFSDENEEVHWVPKGSLPKRGPLRKLYDDFAIIKGHRYGCPVSFNRLTPAWFMNESKKPNTRCDENYDFYTLRTISPGEELTVDYETFSDYPSGA